MTRAKRGPAERATTVRWNGSSASTKEKKPKDATIRAKFDSYRFADYKDHVIDLLARVTRVSVETQAIVTAMREATR